MYPTKLFSALAAALLVAGAGASAPATADDAEIYVNSDPPPESEPLVMISLDWRPNLTSTVCSSGECDFLVAEGYLPPQASYTFFEMLRAVLRKVMAPLTGLRVGLMLNHDSINNCQGPAGAKSKCANGGYMAMGFRPFTVDTTAALAPADPNKDMFDSVLGTMALPQGNQSHFYQGRELFFEFYRYLKGLSVYNGHNGFASFDPGPQDDPNKNINPQFVSSWTGTAAEPVWGFAWDPTIEAGSVMLAADGKFASPGTYISPLLPGNDCVKIFTINFLFQVSQQENDSDTEIRNTIGLSNNGDFEQILTYLNTTDMSTDLAGDQKVISYFLGDARFVDGEDRKMDGFARAGGSGSALSLSADPAKLIATLTEVFRQILSVSTTFTAATLPVNSFDRAQVLDDVYLALFQPQTDRYPQANSYWWGNVKKLELSGLGDAAATPTIVDALGQPAFAPDGRVRFDALTFWTDPTGEDVLDLDRDPDDFDLAGRDGRSVNRGGAGHKIPGFPRQAGHDPGKNNPATPGLQAESGPRRLFYDSGATSLAALEATDGVASSLQSAIGAADAAEALEVVNFMRGLTPDGGAPLEWMTASAMHSRPVPVNYGAKDGHSADNPLIYVAVGTNDGVLRYIRNTDSSGTELGQEVWGFVPTEVMANVRRIVRQEGPGFTGDTTVYGVDGPATVFVDDLNGDGTVNGSDRAILYLGLRRGGRAYYAIDVTDPESPDLLWKIDSTMGDFADLGWTFSQPHVGKMDVDADGTPEYVAIFGGGYDRSYDDEATAPPADPIGNGIYVVNGETGALVRYVQRPEMLDAIPSSVTAVDTDGDDLLDRIYAGDLGGRVWRVDMTPAGQPSDWDVSMLADLGRHAAAAAAGSADDIRFFHQPDVVQSRLRVESDDGATATTVKFDAVLIGSGDRANPLHNTPNNWFFMIRDTNIGILADAADTAYELADLTDVTNCTGCEVPLTSNGWRLRLEAPGEKALAEPLTVANIVFFTTYVPRPATIGPNCAPSEGTGRLYQVSLQNANPLTNRDEPIDDNDDSGDPDDRWEELPAGGIPAAVVFLPPGQTLAPGRQPEPVPARSRWQTFWYLDEDPVQ